MVPCPWIVVTLLVNEKEASDGDVTPHTPEFLVLLSIQRHVRIILAHTFEVQYGHVTQFI